VYVKKCKPQQKLSQIRYLKITAGILGSMAGFTK